MGVDGLVDGDGNCGGCEEEGLSGWASYYGSFGSLAVGCHIYLNYAD